MLSNALFDLGAQYDQMLLQGLRLSGENHEYFLQGRIRRLVDDLKGFPPPARILDFGCGIGHATAELAKAFPNSEVVGVDVAEPALEYARTTISLPNVRFTAMLDESSRPYQLCYTNGTFHHIEPSKRPAILRSLANILRPGGRLAFFENNPWNPFTRLVMRNIPFDRDAILITPGRAAELLRGSGFETCQPTAYLFYFPRTLARLRPMEPSLARLPLGAQYFVLAKTCSR
jgi:SAM-dependent methyltransferase